VFVVCAQVRKTHKYRSKGRTRPKNGKIRQEIALQQKVLKFFCNISPFYKKYLVRADKRTKSNKKTPAKQCRCFL